MALFTVLAAFMLISGCGEFAAQKDKDYLLETDAEKDIRMGWWRHDRCGMFIHWGAYSTLEGYYNGKENPGLAEWIMDKSKIPVDEYEAIAAKFNPVKFNADEWVRVARQAGMKYIVITSRPSVE